MTALWTEGLGWLLDSTPHLPALPVMAWARQTGWALVLVCIAWRGSLGLRRLQQSVRGGLALVLAVVTLLPGPLGLGHWLGLAFQSPSLTTMGLAIWGIAHGSQRRDSYNYFKPDYAARMAWMWTSLAVVALGWLLLLDTLALLPVFMYPWGYSRLSVLIVGLAALLLCTQPRMRAVGGVLLGVVAVFGLTSLPSGNLWDALLDPWLWLLAHLSAWRQLYQRPWRGLR